MFLLTSNYYEDRTVKGVFTSVDKAKKYVYKVMHRENLRWSDPSSISGSVSAYFGGGYLTIEPVELNPKN
jgi:hypothetical protein